jgi:hypothetical protein
MARNGATRAHAQELQRHVQIAVLDELVIERGDLLSPLQAAAAASMSWFRSVCTRAPLARGLPLPPLP